MFSVGDGSSKSFAMLRGDVVTEVSGDMRPRCDSLPDHQSAAAAVGSKRKSILKKEALNREEMEGLLSDSGGVGSSRNSFATPVCGTPARTKTAAAADADDDDSLVVRHLPRLSDSSAATCADPTRRLPADGSSRLPTSQSVATIAEFDTDCDEESSVEGELDARPRCPTVDRDQPQPARIGTGARPTRDDAVSPPLDNARSPPPQNANVPPTDINLNPPAPVVPAPAGSGVPPIPARLQAAPPAAADNLGNHLPPPPAHLPIDQPDTTAFTHNLFPTLDFIDEFAD